MDVLLRYIGGGKLFGICSNLFNVLEYAADREEIAHAVQELKNSGALSALMTGSGSAVLEFSRYRFRTNSRRKAVRLEL